MNNKESILKLIEKLEKEFRINIHFILYTLKDENNSDHIYTLIDNDDNRANFLYNQLKIVEKKYRTFKSQQN